MRDFDSTVLEFMREYPLVVEYKKYTSVYNPSTGGVDAATVVTTEVNALLLDLTLNSNGLSTRFGTMVVAGDKQLFIQPPQKASSNFGNPTPEELTVDPATDRVVVNGQEYKIVTFKEINPTGTNPILYDLYIRR